MKPNFKIIYAFYGFLKLYFWYLKDRLKFISAKFF